MLRANLIAAGLILATVLTGCSKDPTADPEAKPAPIAATSAEVVIPVSQQSGIIESQPIQPSETPDVLRVPGRIALADNLTWRVGVRTEGLVVAVYAGLGDHVEQGQVLARYRADEVRDARARYRTALSELSRLETAAALAQRDYDRMQALLSLKAASVQQVEQERQELLSAQAALRNGQIEVERVRDLLESGLRVPVDPPPNDETADQVAIIAPASGYILAKEVTPGKTVQPSTDTFVIGDLSQVWMLASVRQENLGQLRTGQPASVTASGFPSQQFPGNITNLGQEFDPVTRVMQVRIVLNNPGNRLRPEMLAQAEIPISQSKPILLVPSDAVQQINGQDVVFVRLGEDRFAMRTVRAAEPLGDHTPIVEGLKAGEQVVTRGSFVLKSELLKSSMEE